MGASYTDEIIKLLQTDHPEVKQIAKVEKTISAKYPTNESNRAHREIENEIPDPTKASEEVFRLLPGSHRWSILICW